MASLCSRWEEEHQEGSIEGLFSL